MARLVRVATARNPTEAAMMQAALHDAGILSIDRPTRAFDILDLLAVGPRDILVDDEALDDARELLGVDEPVAPVGSLPAAYAEPPSRLLAKLTAALIAGAGVAYAIWQLIG
jgi:hypothetical protein